MTRILSIIMLLLPLLAEGQGSSLSRKESKTTIEALATLQKRYANVEYLYGSDLAVVRGASGLSGVVRLNGENVIPCEYNIIAQNESPLLMVQDDSLMGFVNRKGEWVQPRQLQPSGACCCEIGHLFSDGHLTVARQGLYGVIDENGKTIVPFVHDNYIYYDRQFKLLYIYDNDMDKCSTVGYVTDLKGKVILGPYDDLTQFSRDGVASFGRDGYYGYVNTKGVEVLPNQYDYVGPFVKGRAVVKQNGHWGVIDKKGRFLISLSNDSLNVRDLWYGIRQIDLLFYDTEGVDNSLGAVNLQGDTVIPFRYEYCWTDNGRRIIMMTDKYNDVYDTKGHMVSRFDEIRLQEAEFSNNVCPLYYAVKQGDLWGFADSDFNIVVPCRYQDAWMDNFGYGIVELDNGHHAVIDMKGKIIVEGPYDNLTPLGKNFFEFYSWDNSGSRKSFSGYLDAYGNSTATPEDIKVMQSWLDREIEERENKVTMRPKEK
ncbi:MAG: WG repeat-containing protein [Bacteroidales bacterium]|nr:WG repeat-containing protein [Bacteroidales bacterium]